DSTRRSTAAIFDEVVSPGAWASVDKTFGFRSVRKATTEKHFRIGLFLSLPAVAGHRAGSRTVQTGYISCLVLVQFERGTRILRVITGGTPMPLRQTTPARTSCLNNRTLAGREIV